MNTNAIFGLSALAFFISSVVVAWLFAWPWLRGVNLRLALLCLVTPHMFFRFLGFSFLVPGVVTASLSKSWTVPTGYGDVMGGILAIFAVIALARMATWAIAAVWIFNVWVTADVLFATLNGLRIGLDPGSLGPGFYILTGFNPPLLVTNVLIFMLLLRGGNGGAAIGPR